MDKIIDELLKIIPLKYFFDWLGFDEKISSILSIIITVILVYFITIYLKKITNHFNNIKNATDLYPYFNMEKVKLARNLYIQTRFQNLSPTREDEIKDSISSIAKIPLIPFFINTAFNEKKENNKYYLILADSGMGKTTFMINLYITYNSRFNRKLDIKLIPFGDERIIEKLKELSKNQKEANNTILLLDAFDEYKGLLPPEISDNLTDDERFRKQFEEITKLTQDFREVVITSRTQYFPGQEKEDYFLKIKNFSTESYHKLVKLYISPFDENEIKEYLNKKYGILKFWNFNKKKIAKKVIKSSPKLMVRPMLLSYIDYFVQKNQIYNTTFDIYNTLVERWIEREAEKRKYDLKEREKFKRDLYEFSIDIALNIFNRSENYIDKETAIKLCNEKKYLLKDYEITGQSLLTRDVNNNWKFAHKSIYEFFIAKYAIEDINFYVKLAVTNFASMDMTKIFCEESNSQFDLLKIKGGDFKHKKALNHYKIDDFYISEYQVTQELWQNIMGYNPSMFIGNDNPVEQVSWYEALEFCNKLSLLTGKTPYYEINKIKGVFHKKNNIDLEQKIIKINNNSNGFRLLSENEWKFAATGGLNSENFIYSGSDRIYDIGWFNNNSIKRTHLVGKKDPNELGLYDMTGNVWEWCSGMPNKDSYIENEIQTAHIALGGCWDSIEDDCKIHFDNNYFKNKSMRIGFRIGLSDI